MTSVSPVHQHPVQVVAAATNTGPANAPKAPPAPGASTPATADPAATLQLRAQALSKLQAQAKVQGDKDWKPGQKVDWS
jgi:hypothetical protein